MTSWARSRASSFMSRRPTWVLAVERLMWSWDAISVLDRPSPIRVSTSRSRSVIASSTAAGRCRGSGRRVVLEQEAAGARAQRGEDILVKVEGGQDQHAHGRGVRGGGDLPGRLDSVHARHLDIHQDEVGFLAPGEFDGLGAGGRFADRGQVRCGVHENAEATANQGLVVGDQNTDGHAPVPASGNTAVTRKPRPGSGAARNCPPYMPTRSRIPVMPCPAAAGLPLPPLALRPALPLSVISSVSASSWQATLSWQLSVAACLITLVIASWMTR